MGLFDMLPRGSQVKCWGCYMDTYHLGDKVEDLYPEYVVLLVEGGYVRVKEGVIVKITENKGRKYYYPEDFPNVQTIDKWGSPVYKREQLEHANIMGGNYYPPYNQHP